MSDDAFATRQAKLGRARRHGLPEKAAGYLGPPPPFAQQFMPSSLIALKRAHKIGVTMAYGTDAFFKVKDRRAGRSPSPTSTALSRPVSRPQTSCAS